MFIIAEISKAHDPGFPASHFDMVLPDNRRPKYIHGLRDDAEAELLRLKQRFPMGEFILFEAVLTARPTRSNPQVILTEPFTL